MRPKSMIQKSTQRTFKYSIEAFIQQIQLSIRFPCKLSIHWNYGQGSVTSVKPVALEKGVARFQQSLSFTSNIVYSQEKQEHVQQKTTIEIFILTQNGNSLAGFVTLDLATLVNGVDKKQIFQIERCPDRSAHLKMKISYHYLTQKYSKINPVQSSLTYKNKDRQKERDWQKNKDNSSLNQYSEGRTELFNRRIDPQSVKNKQLIQRQVTSLKSRLSEYQSKYKSQKIQREKLSDLLKGKQEIYFTLKTQIKRKQIEIDGMIKSLDEYRSQYQRLKIDNDTLIKTRQKLQSIIDNIQKSSYDKISRLQFQNASLIKKYQKIQTQYIKITKQKDSLSLTIKQKSQGINKDKQMFNQNLRQIKKQKQDLLKSYKLDKQTSDKLNRQLNRTIQELQQQLNDIKQKYSITNKKLSKLQQQRIQQITKNNTKIIQLQKLKQSLSIQLSTSKKQLNKKDNHTSQQNKKLQKLINEQRLNNTRLTQSIVDLQNQKKSLSIQIQKYKQFSVMHEESISKLQKQIDHLKYQTNGLNDLLASKNNQIKLLNTKQKEIIADYTKRYQQLEERKKQAIFQFEVQIRQLKRTEENKFLNATNTNIRKQKDLEDAINRQQKLTSHIQTMKQEYKKNQTLMKQKLQLLKISQQQLKHQCMNISKKKQQVEENLIEKMREMQLQIHSLNESLCEAKDNQFRLLEREDRLRVQKQQIHRMYSELKINSLKVREQYQRCKDQLQEFDRNHSQLNKQLQTNQTRYSKLVKQLKDKVLQTQQQKSKLQVIAKQKQRQLSQSSRLLKQQIELLKQQISKKQFQFKKLQDQHRDTLHKQKMKINELQIDLQNSQNQVIKITSISTQKQNLIQQLQSQIKQYRNNLKNIVIQKQSLLKTNQQTQNQRIDLKESLNNYDNQLYNKNRQIKQLKQKNEQLQSVIKQYQSLKKRNKILINDICQIESRILQNNTNDIINMNQSTNPYQDLMELRKKLLLIQTKINKQQQITKINNSNYKIQIQEYCSKIQQNQTEIGRYKNQINVLKKSEETQLEEINAIKIQNQQLLYQINTLQTELISFKTNSSILNTKLKDQYQHHKVYEQDMKKQLEKYQKLIHDTRVQVTQKYQKQKKQLLNNLRLSEQKIQRLEQDNFSLQLQNQKVQQLTKREEENKKVLSRVYELERENFELIQLQKQYEQKNNSTQQKLQWEKNILSEASRTMQLKMENTISQLQSQTNKLNTKNRQLGNILKQKQFLLEQTQKSLITVQQQSQQQINTLKIEKQRVADSEFKLKNELKKIKSQLQLYKTNNQHNKDKLSSMQSILSAKNQLDIEIQSKTTRIIELEQKSQIHNQQIFKLNQTLQEVKWEYQRNLTNKQNEIMNIQQQLYALNSKQNIRMLRQIQFTQKYKLMQLQKKNLLKQLDEYKSKCKILIDNQRSLEVMGIKALEQEKSIIEENQKKHQEIIKILEQQIKNLKNESNFIKKEGA